MKSEFVTYEIALKLKELGFNEECLGIYLNKEFRFAHFSRQVSAEIGQSAPLWQQVIDWFREKYKISIAIDMNCMEDSGFVFYLGNMDDRTTIFESYVHFNTYQKAREQAILKALTLIKNEK